MMSQLFRSSSPAARITRAVYRLAAVAAVAGLVAACQDDSLSSARAYAPISQKTLELMSQKGTSRYAPILIRTYKKEAEFQIWKQRQDGRYVLLKTYPMCRWSGQLGPKTSEGDRQVPEGFYTITPGQMNPNSHYYLSFNVGYPNAYDRAHNYTGGLIMVHGSCSSAGCFSMTDKQIAEIYAIARDAFAGGQREIQMQSLPFHMTAENLAKFRLDPNMKFWKELKKGTDEFDVTRQEVSVGVCNRHYVFGAEGHPHFDPTGPCPAYKIDPTLAAAVSAKEAKDRQDVAALVAKGVKPIRLVYADGGQNAAFLNKDEGDVSRPEALAEGPTVIQLDDPAAPALVKVAATKGKASPARSASADSAISPSSTPVAAYAAPEPPPQQNSTTAFFKHWLGFGGNQQQAAAPPAEPALSQPVDAPLPPRRAALARPAHKTPQAWLSPSDPASRQFAALQGDTFRH